MLFNSFVFVGFFAVVYTLYLALHRRYKAQNVLLLGASYVFYGYWDWRFLSLLLLSTVVDFCVAQGLKRVRRPPGRKLLLAVSVTCNLAILGVFKYFGFFADSLAVLLNAFGLNAGFVTLRIVLPVGISFYTFQTMSYTIDVYRGKLAPTRDFIDFALFVSLFPQLVAGPIERARNLLPQISCPRRVTAEDVNVALYLLLWGYAKKVVVADNVGMIADRVFGDYTHYEGLGPVIGILAFGAQIYCDFSGYSDIARGVARLMGFKLMANFKLPYFALNPRDFWSRWHISLSSWLRDYLYIPLGGNRRGRVRTLRNIAITMLLGGAMARSGLALPGLGRVSRPRPDRASACGREAVPDGRGAAASSVAYGVPDAADVRHRPRGVGDLPRDLGRSGYPHVVRRRARLHPGGPGAGI